MQISALGNFCPDDTAISDDGQQYISMTEEDESFHTTAVHAQTVRAIEGLGECN